MLRVWSELCLLFFRSWLGLHWMSSLMARAAPVLSEGRMCRQHIAVLVLPAMCWELTTRPALCSAQYLTASHSSLITSRGIWGLERVQDPCVVKKEEVLGQDLNLGLSLSRTWVRNVHVSSQRTVGEGTTDFPHLLFYRAGSPPAPTSSLMSFQRKLNGLSVWSEFGRRHWPAG